MAQVEAFLFPPPPPPPPFVSSECPFVSSECPYIALFLLQELVSASSPPDLDILFELEVVLPLKNGRFDGYCAPSARANSLIVLIVLVVLIVLIVLIVPRVVQDADLTKTFKYQKAFVCTICGEVHDLGPNPNPNPNPNPAQTGVLWRVTSTYTRRFASDSGSSATCHATTPQS